MKKINFTFYRKERFSNLLIELFMYIEGFLAMLLLKDEAVPNVLVWEGESGQVR